MIPIIDLFAGPGGLGEGFSAVRDSSGEHIFKIVLSIEKDLYAHKTLRLRAFFRQFPPSEIPKEYFAYIKDQTNESFEIIKKKFAAEWEAAEREACRLELAKNNRSDVIQKARDALGGASEWLLIGGPPCQAYSLVGRARNADKIKNNHDEWDKDERHTLYKEYLNMISELKPTVFVMENVKGILSAQHEGGNVYKNIISDLKSAGEGYRIYSLAKGHEALCDDGSDYIVKAEEYGIPQARHRVILVGVSTANEASPNILSPKKPISTQEVIGDLPKLRSSFSNRSKTMDNTTAGWKKYLAVKAKRISEFDINWHLADYLEKLDFDSSPSITGGSWVTAEASSNTMYNKWLCPCAEQMNGIPNHQSRTHMSEDLCRYLFCSCYAEVMSENPKLMDFPQDLLPKHKNIDKSDVSNAIFSDRFRVQVANRFSTTITSHISKDGHYYIHYDPLQCRSLTVREAARLQTFPDDYFFEGNKTEQYKQVGNAVPPLLAYQIAINIAPVFSQKADDYIFTQI